MNNSVYKITLDMHDTTSQVLMNMKKNDSGREVHICFTDGGKPFKMTDGVIATFRAKKPDGTILFNNCHTDADHILYTLTNQTTSEVGIVECEVTLYGRDLKQITSARFSILVEDILYSDSEVESSDEFTALTEAIVGASNVNATVIPIEKGAIVSITDRYDNEHSTTIYHGAKGERGEDGINGVAVATEGFFAFNVTEDGMLQVTCTGEDMPNFYLDDGGHLCVDIDDNGWRWAGGSIKTGEGGKDGFSPIANVNKEGNVTTITITDKKGTTSAQVFDGTTPQKGVDYWTQEDITQIKSYIDEQIGGALNGTY